MNAARKVKLRALGSTARIAAVPPERGFDQQELRRIGQFSLRRAGSRLRSLASLSASPHLQHQLLGLSALLERHATQLGAMRTSSRRKVASHG
jgi:hypothetical protein